MTFTIQQIDHVVLRVADLARAIAFYETVLGCKVERRVESFGLVQLRAGASLIDLIDGEPPGAGEHRNMDHVALRIDPFDEAALRAHLASHGVEHGAVESRYGAEGTGPSLYLYDPDGNQVELKGPPEVNPATQTQTLG
ncbi:MAG: VOC family protein [Rhodospirillales bacterium]